MTEVRGTIDLTTSIACRRCYVPLGLHDVRLALLRGDPNPNPCPVPNAPTAAASLSRFCADPRSRVRLGLVHQRRRGCRQRLGQTEVRCPTRSAAAALPAGIRRARVCHTSRALAQHLHLWHMQSTHLDVCGRSPVGALSPGALRRALPGGLPTARTADQGFYIGTATTILTPAATK